MFSIAIHSYIKLLEGKCCTDEPLDIGDSLYLYVLIHNKYFISKHNICIILFMYIDNKVALSIMTTIHGTYIEVDIISVFQFCSHICLFGSLIYPYSIYSSVLIY